MAAPLPVSRPEQPSRRVDEREARVHWILDAALDIVVAEGIAALTTPALARKLGYTPAAFYRYFASKEALLVALETRTAERYYARYFEALAAAREALEPRLRGATPRGRALAEIALLTRTYADVARAAPEQFRLVGVLVTGDRSWLRGDAADRLRDFVVPRIAALIGHFARAEEVGALSAGSAPRRLMTLWLATHAVLAAAPLAAAHPGLIDTEALRVEALRALLLGWGASAKNVDAALAATDD